MIANQRNRQMMLVRSNIDIKCNSLFVSLIEHLPPNGFDVFVIWIQLDVVSTEIA